jgi:hypothetical protein
MTRPARAPLDPFQSLLGQSEAVAEIGRDDPVVII